MKNFITTIYLLTLFCCFIACKSQNDPTPPDVTTIDETLLKGWWATPLTNNSQTKIYFGEDNFFYQDTVKDAAPIAGFWKASDNTIAYSPQLNGAAITNFEVIKLTATELQLKTGVVTVKFNKITQPAITTSAISTIAGNGAFGYTGDGGPAISAQIAATGGIHMDQAGNIFFCDRGNRVVRKISAADGKISTIAGTGNRGIPANFADNSPAISADLTDPTSIAMDASQNIYISEPISNRIDKISADGKISCVAGCSMVQGSSGDGGPAKLAALFNPQGIAFDVQGNLYIADETNKKIRKITNGIINTIAGTGVLGYSGDGGPAINAKLSAIDVSVNTNGDVYFTDLENNRIRKITAATGIISTIAGAGVNGSAGDGVPAINTKIYLPLGIKVSPNGNVYFTELSHTIRKVDGTTGIISRVAGTGYEGYTGDGIHASAYSLNNPYSITTDAAGNLYVSEAARLRKIASN